MLGILAPIHAYYLTLKWQINGKMELSSCVSTEVILSVLEMLMFYIIQNMVCWLSKCRNIRESWNRSQGWGNKDAIWEMGPWGPVSDGDSVVCNGKVMHSSSSEKIMKLALWFEGRAEQGEERPCLEVRADTVSASRMCKHCWSARGYSYNLGWTLGTNAVLEDIHVFSCSGNRVKVRLLKQWAGAQAPCTGFVFS